MNLSQTEYSNFENISNESSTTFKEFPLISDYHLIPSDISQSLEGNYLMKTDHETYKGAFIKGKFHGTGTLVKPPGEVYKGEFFEGKRHGYGEYMYNDGKVYIGEWKNGKQHGSGVLRLSDDRSKNVNFHEGRRISLA